MTGSSQAATIRAALSTISLMERSPTSGRPRSAAAVPNPVMYTAGNPASSTSRAPSPSNTPGARTGSGPASSSRSRRAPFEPTPRDRPIPHLLSRTETEMLRPAIITACSSARSSAIGWRTGRSPGRTSPARASRTGRRFADGPPTPARSTTTHSSTASSSTSCARTPTRRDGLFGEGRRAVARGDLPDDALGVGEVPAGPAPLAPLGRRDDRGAGPLGLGQDLGHPLLRADDVGQRHTPEAGAVGRHAGVAGQGLLGVEAEH